MPTANGTHEQWPDVDPLDELTVDPEHVAEDLAPAQRAVVTHQAVSWPTGRFCQNCHATWPCRLYRWGHLVLWHAGWRESDFAELVRRAGHGEVPWA